MANYLRTEKGGHDCRDVLRAVLLIGAVMAIIRILWDQILIAYGAR